MVSKLLKSGGKEAKLTETSYLFDCVAVVCNTVERLVKVTSDAQGPLTYTLCGEAPSHPIRTGRGGPYPRAARCDEVRRHRSCNGGRMITEQIQARIKQAMRDGDQTTKDVLRVALGEIQTVEHRSNVKATEEEALAIVKKLVKSVEETLGLTPDGPAKDILVAEVVVLRALLPASLGVPQIVALLEGQREALKAARNEGAATGVAMKALKEQGVVADGKDVQEAVKQLRA